MLMDKEEKEEATKFLSKYLNKQELEESQIKQTMDKMNLSEMYNVRDQDFDFKKLI